METWNDFLTVLQEGQNLNDLAPTGIDLIEFIQKLNIPFNLNFQKCIENFDAVKNYSILNYRAPNFGTSSITRILTEKQLGILPDHYSNWFFASFPDVYIWATPNTESKLETLEILETIVQNQDKYLINHSVFNTEAYLLLCTEYKKQNNSFETI